MMSFSFLFLVKCIGFLWGFSSYRYGDCILEFTYSTEPSPVLDVSLNT